MCKLLKLLYMASSWVPYNSMDWFENGSQVTKLRPEPYSFVIDILILSIGGYHSGTWYVCYTSDSILVFCIRRGYRLWTWSSDSFESSELIESRSPRSIDTQFMWLYLGCGWWLIWSDAILSNILRGFVAILIVWVGLGDSLLFTSLFYFSITRILGLA